MQCIDHAQSNGLEELQLNVISALDGKDSWRITY